MPQAMSIASSTHRVWFDQNRCFQCQSLFHFNVIADVTEFLLHHAYRFEIGGVIECIATQQKQL